MNGSSEDRVRLGMVVAGSLTEGMEVRLDAGTSVEDIRVGRYVTVSGRRMRFFGVVTDVSLGSTDPAMRTNPPDVSNPLVAQVVSGTAAYGTLTVEPMLTLSNDPLDALDGPQPSKTVPPHFAQVSLASEEDVESVFGGESAQNFWIGSPLDMESKLCLNIASLVTRSNGVFGKSGTGKTFLTRLLLAGIVQSGEASNLVFDMQNEYGWRGYSEADREVKGLKQLFSSKVAVFSLDPASSERRGLAPDYAVRIGYEEVEPEDIALLRETLNLSEVAADAAHSLGATYHGRPAGSLAHASATSFHPVKPITTAEGGAVFTDLDDWRVRAEEFRNHGIVRDRARHLEPDGDWHYEVQNLGLNYRLPDVLCALGLRQLEKLNDFIARRREIAARYSAALGEAEGIELPVVLDGVEPGWHLYVVRVRDAARRRAMFDHLRSEGLIVQLHYVPVHLHPVFRELGFMPGSVPRAEDYAARAISIPIYPAMSDDDVDRVIETVLAASRELL